MALRVSLTKFIGSHLAKYKLCYGCQYFFVAFSTVTAITYQKGYVRFKLNTANLRKKITTT
jgi:hypothetical protein